MTDLAPRLPADLAPAPPAPAANRLDRALAAIGRLMSRSRRAIRRLQWTVVVVYLVLIVVPTLLPLPTRIDRLWNDVTVFAQFVFWGIWWPFVLLSMILVGRLWCGILCPEGALAERASGIGLGRAVPTWIRWKGWPFVAFVMTTLYGQMTSVYQYPAPTLLILGGSTAAAIAVGLVWGRDKRVWCRWLCPVSGVFGLLAKLAPLHFRVDRAAWDDWEKPKGAAMPRVDCAPLVPIRTMRGGSACHMCGRCSGFRDAVTLARRSPNHEIVHVAGDDAKPWETALIVVGLMGVAAGAFRWTGSDLFVGLRQAIAEKLVDLGAVAALDWSLPWFVLTDYPARNDVMTVVDGAALVLFVAASAAFSAVAVGGGLALATRLLGPWTPARFHHLAQSLIPVAAAGVFLGLSALTVTMLKAEGIRIPHVDEIRAAILVGSGLWSASLARAVTGRYAAGLRRIAATAAMTATIALAVADWATLFWSI